MSKVTNVDLDDDAVSDDEVLAASNGVNGADAANGDATMADAPLAAGDAPMAGDLRVVELEVATDEPAAPLLVETDALDGIIQEPVDMDDNDEVLQIGDMQDPWIDPEFAEQNERMEKAFGIDGDGERDREVDTCCTKLHLK
eukprot:s143_g22.t1